jgi:transcription elongation factor Elf1
MHAPDEGRYDCPHCGEEIVVPVDADAGEAQEYVEDCPICCSPVLLSVSIEDDGEVRIVARPE